MSKGSINQRLKFLVEKLAPSVRAFSEAIGDSTSNTNNYIGSRQTEPKPEYLAKVVNHFSTVNAHWLLTGEGEAFTTDASNQHINSVDISGNSNNVASGKGGKAIQKNYNLSDCEKERDNYKDKLEAAQREIELLTGQVQMQATIIRGKDEMLDLLRGSVNRPN